MPDAADKADLAETLLCDLQAIFSNMMAMMKQEGTSIETRAVLLELADQVNFSLKRGKDV